MNCKFISELRKLSKLSAEAVQNVDHFDSLKKYMHIIRNTEIDFRKLMHEISQVNHKQLVLVCGSAGDGKSHLLSYLKCNNQDGILDMYTIINDATESDSPNQTAIETLSERIAAFRDERLDDGGCEKVILAINLGMLNNFIDSEQGRCFSKLKQYVLNNNIFTVAPPLPFNKDGIFQHIDFSNYQVYTLTAEGAKSDYLSSLFEKVFSDSICNPFFDTYINQGSICPHHTQCPVRHNFEFLMEEKVRNLLIQRIIEVCVKNKMVVTSRDVLNFIFDAVVSPNFNEKEFWNVLSNPVKYLETYISFTTPMLIFENKGTSSLIDCMTDNAKKGENNEKRDEDILNFYAADDITPMVLTVLNGSKYAGILQSIGLSPIDNNRDDLKKYDHDAEKWILNDDYKLPEAPETEKIPGFDVGWRIYGDTKVLTNTSKVSGWQDDELKVEIDNYTIVSKPVVQYKVGDQIMEDATGVPSFTVEFSENKPAYVGVEVTHPLATEEAKAKGTYVYYKYCWWDEYENGVNGPRSIVLQKKKEGVSCHLIGWNMILWGRYKCPQMCIGERRHSAAMKILKLVQKKCRQKSFVPLPF